MHLKRNKIPKTWPIQRKGTTFVVVPSHNKSNGIPFLIILRDILKITKSRKEVKNILNEGKVKINGKLIKDEKYSVGLFDNLTIGEKNYRFIFSENGKIKFDEISEKETEHKIVKVIGKKILAGNKIQINFSDGRNLITKEKLKTGDSVKLNLKEKKIEKVLEMKEGAECFVIGGKHLGKIGKVYKIEKNSAEIVINSNKIKISLKNLMAIEK